MKEKTKPERVRRDKKAERIAFLEANLQRQTLRISENEKELAQRSAELVTATMAAKRLDLLAQVKTLEALMDALGVRIEDGMSPSCTRRPY